MRRIDPGAHAQSSNASAAAGHTMSREAPLRTRREHTATGGGGPCLPGACLGRTPLSARRAVGRQRLPSCGGGRAPCPDSASATQRTCVDQESITGVRHTDGKSTAPPMRPQRKLLSTNAESTSKSTVPFLVFSPACALYEAAVYPARNPSAQGGAFVSSLGGVCDLTGTHHDDVRAAAHMRAGVRARAAVFRKSALQGQP